MKTRASLLALLAVFLLALPSGIRAEEPKNNYVDLGIGGDFPVSGYGGVDSRFALTLEGGFGMFALPVVFSFGQDTFILGLKPRFQYWFRPFSGVPGLALAPGLAPVFNYWHADAAFASADMVELGIQPSVRVRYDVTPAFNVMLVPFSMDFNIWRHASAPFFEPSDSESETHLRIFYNFGVAVGLNF